MSVPYITLEDSDGNTYNLPEEFWITTEDVSVRKNILNKAYSPGALNLADKFLGSKTVTIEGKLRADTLAELEVIKRDFSKAILKTSKLTLSDDYVSRYLIVSDPDLSFEYILRPMLDVSVTFLVEYPFWLDSTETEMGFARADLIDRGDCESSTPPCMFNEVSIVENNCTFARDNTVAYRGSYSYKFTKTIAAGTVGYVSLQENQDTTDLHGLFPGETYTFGAWIYIPSASGILGSEVRLRLFDYQAGWVSTDQYAANTYDAWQYVEVTRTIRAAATGTIIRIVADSTAALNEYFYVDEINLLYPLTYLIKNGDCESSDNSPLLYNEDDDLLSNCTFARDNTVAYRGSYSYKFTKTIAVGTSGSAYLHENALLNDLHGLFPGETYTFGAWIYIPSASGILGSEVYLQLLDYQAGWEATISIAINTYDAWQYVEVTRTIRAAATGIRVIITAFSDAAINEYFYVDEISLTAPGDFLGSLLAIEVDAIGSDYIMFPNIDIENTFGQNNPGLSLKNLSDGSMRFIYNDSQFLADDLLQIDNGAGTVKKNNNNAIENVVSPARFLRLQPLRNKFEYEGADCLLTFKFRKAYLI